ncbi:hypothetical protein [Nostoc sp.]
MRWGEVYDARLEPTEGSEQQALLIALDLPGQDDEILLDVD